MGIKLTSIIPRTNIDFNELKNKKVAIDASNMLYQFLASIRGQDGMPLMDSKGRITSHLMGIWTRLGNLLQKDIKMVVVFDGKPPELKFGTQESRSLKKEIAQKKYLKAKDEEDIDSMRKYAKQTSKLTPDMIKSSKELINAMGIPTIFAPSESDAQISFMSEKNDVDYVASSDYDCLLFGAKKLILNLTLSQKRKLPGGGFIYTKPELLELDDILKHLKINPDQLIALGILVGTDYNPKGIPGIGPKKALNLVQQYKKFDKMFSELKPDFNWKQIYAIFKSMPIMKNYQLKWSPPNEQKILKILVDEHDFSESRVNSLFEKIKPKEQKGLDSWN